MNKKTPWNKGLTKDSDPRLAKIAQSKKDWWASDNRESTRKKIGVNSSTRMKNIKPEDHPNWKGGRRVDKRDGYVYVYSPNHPNKVKSTNGNGGYVLEHRLIMEKAIGRYLEKDEDINHINGIKDDNRLENLMLVRHNAHYSLHKCPQCNFEWGVR